VQAGEGDGGERRAFLRSGRSIRRAGAGLCTESKKRCSAAGHIRGGAGSLQDVLGRLGAAARETQKKERRKRGKIWGDDRFSEKRGTPKNSHKVVSNDTTENASRACTTSGREKTEDEDGGTGLAFQRSGPVNRTKNA